MVSRLTVGTLVEHTMIMRPIMMTSHRDVTPHHDGMFRKFPRHSRNFATKYKLLVPLPSTVHTCLFF